MAHVWTIALAENGHVYLATATYVRNTEAWHVVLTVDGECHDALSTDDPCLTALQLIADAQAVMSQ